MSRVFDDIGRLSFKLNGIYRGVVESNDTDPDMAGRIKVRVFGVHSPLNTLTDDGREGIPVNELPWAEPACGLIEGSISGLGLWSIPVQGSHVFIFFENGDPRKPRYFATVPGIPEKADGDNKYTPYVYERNGQEVARDKVGFRDPDDVYPYDEPDAPYGSKVGEPDLHRLAREDDSETIVGERNSNLDEGIESAIGNDWDEPPSAFAAEYPHNIVLSTHGGITVEVDSTPDNERIHIWHPSKTFIEIDSAGNMVIKNDGERYDLTKSNKYEYTEGDRESRTGGYRADSIGATWDVKTNAGNITIKSGEGSGESYSNRIDLNP